MSGDSDYEVVVPFAYDAHGVEVRADTADRHGEYWCPDCYQKVILKRGSVRRAHFAHLPDHDRPCDFAAGETEDHYRAKLQVVRAIREGVPIGIGRSCTECRRRVWSPLPTTGAKADLEYVLHAARPTSDDVTHVRPEGDYRLDVALLDASGNLVGAIEVFAQHAVDDFKSQSLSALLPWWVEVRASEILTSSQWHPLSGYLPQQGKCGRCEAVERFAAPYPLTSPRSVACPVKQQADLFRDCAQCEHFEDFDGAFMTCTGKGRAVVDDGSAR